MPGVTNSRWSCLRLLSKVRRWGVGSEDGAFLFLLSFPLFFPWCVLSFCGDRPGRRAKGR